MWWCRVCVAGSGESAGMWWCRFCVAGNGESAGMWWCRVCVAGSDESAGMWWCRVSVADSGESAGMWWCRVSVAGSGESSHLAGKLLVTCCFSFQQKCVRNKLKETRKRKSLTLFSFLLRCHLVLQRVCYDDVLHHPVPEIYHLLLTNDVKNGVYQLCITSSALNQSLQCVTDCCLTTTR